MAKLLPDGNAQRACDCEEYPVVFPLLSHFLIFIVLLFFYDVYIFCKYILFALFLWMKDERTSACKHHSPNCDIHLWRSLLHKLLTLGSIKCSVIAVDSWGEVRGAGLEK